MTKAEDRNYTIGCFGLVAIVYGLFWLISDPNAGNAERAGYDACIEMRKTRFERRNPDASLDDQNIADMVSACSHIAKSQVSN